MGYILDFIFLCIAGAAIASGVKKGIVRTVLDVAAFVLAIVFAAQLAAPFANGLYDAFLDTRLQERVEEALPESTGGNFDFVVILDGLPDFVTNYLENAGYDADALRSQIAGDMDSADAAQQITEKVVRPVCVAALRLILFLLLCIVLSAVLKIVAGFVSKLFKLPIVRSLDKGLGAALGALEGVVLIVFFSVLLLALSPQIGGEFTSFVSDSFAVQQVERILPESLSEIL